MSTNSASSSSVAARPRIRGWRSARVVGGSILVALAGWSAVGLATYAVGLVRGEGPPSPAIQMTTIIGDAAAHGLRVVENRTLDSRGTGELSRLVSLRSRDGADEIRIYDLRAGRLEPTLRFRPTLDTPESSGEGAAIRIVRVEDLDGNGTSEVIAYLAPPGVLDRSLRLAPPVPVMIAWDWARNEHTIVPLLGTRSSRKPVLKVAHLAGAGAADWFKVWEKPIGFTDARARIGFAAHTVEEFDVRRTEAGAFFAALFLVRSQTFDRKTEKIVGAAVQVRFWRIRPWLLGTPLYPCNGTGTVVELEPTRNWGSEFGPPGSLRQILDREFRRFAPSYCL